MSELLSIARATAKPGRAADVERELRARIEPTVAQPGNIEFSLFRSLDEPGAIVAVERWASREDWERHIQGPHVTSLLAVFAELLDGHADIALYTPTAGPGE